MMDLLLATSGGESQSTSGGYVDDVFSAYTYTGNGSTQTINNGIDLAGKGGLVWVKNRGFGAQPILMTDTSNYLSSNLTNGNTAYSYLSSLNSNGFSLANTSSFREANYNNDTYASWTFRKAAKFFDVVTYTGNGASNRTLSHQLNADVGMITVKATSTTGGWWVFHRSATGDLVLNTTAAQTASKANIPSATTSTFTVSGSANTNGVTYVAYLWAHDPSTEGIIQCGSFTTDGSGNATVILGWEPQLSMVKASSTTSDWIMQDSMRGWNMSANDATLLANTSGPETVNTERGNPTATGFDFKGGTAFQTYIYLAIRRPNKPPTSGTGVYNAIARTGTGAAATVTGVGFAPDLAWSAHRDAGNRAYMDRLRGANIISYTTATGTEISISTDGNKVISGWDVMDGVRVGADGNYGLINTGGGYNFITHFFRRAPGFMDVVCDTGTGVAHAIAHNLTKAPELIIRKSRGAATQWEVWHSALAATEKLVLNSNAAKATDATAWNSTLPAATQFTVGTGANVNANAATFVTYLFATLAGISKVGSYTGNGSNQTIDCGFSAGARFFLVKATSTTGNWWVFDSARGIVSSFDPSLALNSTAAEVTSADAVDPDPYGIIVNQEATCSINATGVNYVFLAIA